VFRGVLNDLQVLGFVLVRNQGKTPKTIDFYKVLKLMFCVSNLRLSYGLVVLVNGLSIGTLKILWVFQGYWFLRKSRT